MSKLDEFVSSAREKQMPDDKIKNALLAQGWDANEIDLALLGLKAPTPELAARPSGHTAHGRPSLSALPAALHHVLLWFFAGASAISIGGVASSLFGGSVSPDALAAMIAVTVVTFTPYAIFYVGYLRKVRRTPALIPGRVWSIITICLHSIGAMAAAITLVVSLIMGSTQSVVVASGLIALMCLIILTTYVLAAFAKPSKVRRTTLTLHLIVLFVLLGTLFVISLIRLAPARADEATSQNLVSAVASVRNYTRQHDALPEATSQLNMPDGVTYQRLSEYRYEICADFRLNSSQGSRFYEPQLAPDDSFVSTYDFNYHKQGENCFGYDSAQLNHSNRTLDLEEPAKPAPSEREL